MSASIRFGCKNKKLQNLTGFKPHNLLRLDVALVNTVCHPYRKKTPICDITGLMAVGKEKWQNPKVVLEDSAQQQHISFSHAFHQPKQNPWPCLLSTDLTGRG